MIEEKLPGEVERCPICESENIFYYASMKGMWCADCEHHWPIGEGLEEKEDG